MLVMSFLSFTSPPSSSNSVQGSAPALGPDQGSGDPQGSHRSLPPAPESSGWTEWKPLTACSATCGGGIYKVAFDRRFYLTFKVERERNCTSSPCHNDSSIMTERETRGISCNPNGCRPRQSDLIHWPQVPWTGDGASGAAPTGQLSTSAPAPILLLLTEASPARNQRPGVPPPTGRLPERLVTRQVGGVYDGIYCPPFQAFTAVPPGWKCAKKGEIHNAYKMGSKMHQ